MLFTLRSMFLFSSAIAASVFLSVSVCGPVTVEPAALDAAAPVVMPGWLLTPPPRLPDDCAVPEVLVPGAGGVASLEALPTPDGSLPELFKPPTLAGPDGTPLTPAVPAPAEPAFGEPTALLLPAEGPLAAPPALAPPRRWRRPRYRPLHLRRRFARARSQMTSGSQSPRLPRSRMLWPLEISFFRKRPWRSLVPARNHLCQF